jgi:hypothetical protein
MIDAERQRLDVARFLEHIAAKIGNREAALSSISVAELAHVPSVSQRIMNVTSRRFRIFRSFLCSCRPLVRFSAVPELPPIRRTNPCFTDSSGQNAVQALTFN